jgi:ABC-type transport system involved in multi-copper enzyme maturation permease subunit
MMLNRVRLYKEFRALSFEWMLGVFGIVVFALAAKYDTDVDRQQLFLFGSFGIYAVFTFVLAAMSLGSEYDYGTIQLLLSQPVPRKKIWSEKITILFLQMISLNIILVIVMVITRDCFHEDYSFRDFVISSLFLFFFGMIGGLFFSLYVRQTHLAVWCSLFAPIIILFAEGYLDSAILWYTGFSIDQYLKHAVDGPTLLIILFAPWYIIGYFISHRKFLKLDIAKDLKEYKRTETDNTHPISFGKVFTIPIPRNRWSAIILKEVLLQKTPLLVAVLILFLWFMDAGLVLLVNSDIDRRDLAYPLVIIIRPLMFFVLPLTIGACSVSGERNTGVMDWQHSLPFSRKRQWIIKSCVCLSLTAVIVLGVGLGLEYAFWTRVGTLRMGIKPDSFVYGVLSLGALASGLYASTLAKLTLQALAGAFIIPMVGAMLFVWGALHGIPDSGHLVTPGWGTTLTLVSTPFIVTFVYVFGYWNYIRRWEGVWWTVVQVVVLLGGAYTLGWIGSELG